MGNIGEIIFHLGGQSGSRRLSEQSRDLLACLSYWSFTRSSNFKGKSRYVTRLDENEIVLAKNKIKRQFELPTQL